jgi:TPR repeat protein
MTLMLYRLAATQGHARAQCALGLLHSKGDGMPQSFAEAVRLLGLAAAQGDAEAQAKGKWGAPLVDPREYVKGVLP